MTTHDGLDGEALEQLRVLTERNVVGIRAGEVFCGTGFLVTPDTALTCAHVVAGRGEGSMTAMVGGRTVAVEVVSLVPETKGAGSTYGFPDLAEVRLSEPAHDVRGVWLGSAGPRQAAAVSVHGFSGHTLEPGVQPDTLHLTVAGRSGRFVRLQWDQVVQGFSGSPVLDTTTGRVCGVLKASRHERGMSGGWLIPVDAVEECSPGLLERNHAAHRPGTVWFDLARDRRGRQAGLFGPEPGGLSPRTTPAQMLARGAMPFVDRPELGELQNWCWELDDQLLRLLYAPGGSGKTRLSAELCHRLRHMGWIAGFADRESLGDPLRRPQWLEGLTAALGAGFPCLVVFDYAQARLGDISALMAHVHRHRPDGITLRVLLLARSEEPLWHALKEEFETHYIEDWALRGASSQRLPNTLSAKDPGTLVTEAFGEFARLLECPWVFMPPSLARRAARQDSVLGMLAAALDAVLTLRQGQEWKESDDPLARICRHEITGWYTLLEDRLGTGGVLAGRTGRLMAEGLLLVPTLAQRRDRGELTALLTSVRRTAFPGQPPVNAPAVHSCLRALYPATEGDHVAPLEPDRLGEILVRRVLAEPESSGDAVAYLGTVLDGSAFGSEQARTTAVVETLDVLARARGCTTVGRVADHPAHTVLDRALAQAVRDNPRVLVPALVTVGARVPHAEPLADLIQPVLQTCETDLLRRVEPRLPRYPSSLSALSALVLRRLLHVPDTGSDDTSRHLRLTRLRTYSLRLEESGHREDAVRAADEAVLLSRDLVRRSAQYRSDYAAALHNLSLLRHRSGQTDSALGLSVEAVSLYRQLIGSNPGTRHRTLMDMAGALSTLALLRLGDTQVNGAARDAAEGVMRCEQVPEGAREDEVYLDCLETLAECRHRTGRTEEALTSSMQAVERLEDVVRLRPGRYLPRLPETLQRHGFGLIRAGRFHEAYQVLSRAATERAALPLRTSPRRREQQALVLQVLLQLSDELDEFTHEHASWVQMKTVLDGRTS
ncbi:trypsin-like peptidase domain-containing protein [Streptomyces xinghaiensis]|uniref:trypsin-like peptidase domain-containing protein n=1 Tax=Streptomyces xinghaiensis TaxID=1038928 RepID=UPI002E15EF9F|nr:trypsin-like peptidase domain-containing protein [Streptomyces xinghaiensis]WSQ75071.1 trypsin-like peptidase domain-containing protein [Streptomyces xinghaiensis]